MSQLSLSLSMSSFQLDDSVESTDQYEPDKFRVIMSTRVANKKIEQSDSPYRDFDYLESSITTTKSRKRKRADQFVMEKQSIIISPKKRSDRKSNADTKSKKKARKKARAEERAPAAMEERFHVNDIVTQQLLAPVVDVKRVVAAQIAEVLAGASATQRPAVQTLTGLRSVGNIENFKIEVNTSPLITFRVVPRNEIATIGRHNSADAPWRQPERDLGTYEEFCGVSICGSPVRGWSAERKQQLEPTPSAECGLPELFENVDLLSANFNVDFAGMNSEIVPSTSVVDGRRRASGRAQEKLSLSKAALSNDATHAQYAQNSPHRHNSSQPAATASTINWSGRLVQEHNTQNKVSWERQNSGCNENIPPPTNGAHMQQAGSAYAEIRRRIQELTDEKEKQFKIFNMEMNILAQTKCQWQRMEPPLPIDDTLTDLFNLGPDWTDFSAYGLVGPPMQYGIGEGWDEMLQVIVNARAPRLLTSEPL